MSVNVTTRLTACTVRRVRPSRSDVRFGVAESVVIDLWVLVDDRSGQQHRANAVAKDLGEDRFDGDRYDFQILVESPASVRGREVDLEEVFVDAITLVDSDELRTLKQEVLGSA